MNKIALFIVLLCCLIANPSCNDKKAGTCSISCGGIGTGQPFVQTNHPFVTEKDCKKMGEDKGKSCKTSFCPLTGNSNDCYQVYP